MARVRDIDISEVPENIDPSTNSFRMNTGLS
jgi:hypothetical protein